MSKKTVIITGALGFIGSHTAKVFKSAGYYVIGIDRFATIPTAAQYLDQLMVGDFVSTIEAAINSTVVTAIVHCAGTSLVGPSIKDPGEYYNNNAAKTNTMMTILANIGWKGTIVFSSSAATYGVPVQVPIREFDAKIPVSPYGWSKLFCERIIEDHCTAAKMRGIALRYFNAAGCDPDGTLGHVVNDSHMIPRVLSAYQQGMPFTLYGENYLTPDGTCIRDYLHVMDIAAAHLEAVVLADTLPPASFLVYNLGTGHGYSNSEIIETCEEVVNGIINCEVGPCRPGDPAKLVADSSQFQKDTPWSPKYSDINTIVRTAWNWQKTLY